MTDARIQEFGSIPDLQEGDVINIENIGGVESNFRCGIG